MDKAGRVREVSQRDRSENLQSQRQVPLNPYREAVPGDESVRRQLAADPGVFPDCPAPVVRNAGAERELIMMRWGMPPPPRAGGFPITNIRNTQFKKPH